MVGEFYWCFDINPQRNLFDPSTAKMLYKTEDNGGISLVDYKDAGKLESRSGAPGRIQLFFTSLDP